MFDYTKKPTELTPYLRLEPMKVSLTQHADFTVTRDHPFKGILNLLGARYTPDVKIAHPWWQPQYHYRDRFYHNGDRVYGWIIILDLWWWVWAVEIGRIVAAPAEVKAQQCEKCQYFETVMIDPGSYWQPPHIEPNCLNDGINPVIKRINQLHLCHSFHEFAPMCPFYEEVSSGAISITD